MVLARLLCVEKVDSSVGKERLRAVPAVCEEEGAMGASCRVASFIL